MLEAGDGGHCLLYGLYEGQTVRVIDGEMWLSTHATEKGHVVPGHVLDELLDRGWARFTDPADPESAVAITERGTYHLDRWCQKRLKCRLSEVAQCFMLAPKKGV